MAKPNNNEDIDLYELLSRADRLLEEREEQGVQPDPATFEPKFEESMVTDDTVVYRNAANGYGARIPQPQSAPAPRPMTQAEQAASSIRAYNADFRNERERGIRAEKQNYEETAYIPTNIPAPTPVPPPAPEAPQTTKRKGGCLKKLLIPVVLILAVALLMNLILVPPKTDKPIGDRRPGVSAILLCGADEGVHQTEGVDLGFQVVVEHGLEGRHLGVHHHNVLRDTVAAQRDALVGHGHG